MYHVRGRLMGGSIQHNNETPTDCYSKGSDTYFHMDSELEMSSYYNRNSGNQVATYTLSGAAGVFDDNEDYEAECNDRVYDEEYGDYVNCEECGWCLSFIGNALPSAGKYKEFWEGQAPKRLVSASFWWNG